MAPPRPGLTPAQALAAATDVMRREVQALDTPLERAQLATGLLREVAEVQRGVAALRMAAVAELRQQGWSYRAIGSGLGLSANAVAQIERQRLGRSRARRPDGADG